ncbi:unnamed protein product [Calicophoron daubneyi]|uniref:Bifunctional lysine-specific demethylase and histidyl-hydroxylase n=2 Tax=Calicophoron daubneyi TaxID=300641 RepID=A0AAV2T351_CALDB
MISPISIHEFFSKYFEKNPLRIKRDDRSYYADWLCTKDIDHMLKEERVMFTEHIDLATYENGHRYTRNPPGRAFRSVVWDHYNMGCSVRLLCPQLFFNSIRYRLGLLQEYFGCFVGANVYLTPPASQGFAPHYDDIEGFVMQLEGTKLWRVYAPRNSYETLPRTSSPNLSELELGEPILTVNLEPGDMLYIPRGFIHQACTPSDRHSLHITVSTYQKHTWGDLLSSLLPVALQSAIESNVSFREGLPVGFLRHLGCFAANMNSVASEDASPAEDCRKRVRKGVVRRLRMLANFIESGSYENKEKAKQLSISSDKPKPSAEKPMDPLYAAADLMAVDLISQSLPPQLDAGEACCHVEQQGERWHATPSDQKDENNSDDPPRVVHVVELEPDTEIRLVRWSAVRVIRHQLSPVGKRGRGVVDHSHESNDDDDKQEAESSTGITLYHSLNNTLTYKERELDDLAVLPDYVPALDYLCNTFPKFVAVEDLPLDSLEAKMEAANGLYEAGLLITSCPLEAESVYDDSLLEASNDSAEDWTDSDVLFEDSNDEPRYFGDSSTNKEDTDEEIRVIPVVRTSGLSDRTEKQVKEKKSDQCALVPVVGANSTEKKRRKKKSQKHKKSAEH